jgi:hypothetical protein
MKFKRLFIAFISMGLSVLSANALGSSQLNSDLLQASGEMNLTLPQLVDDNTRLDRTSVVDTSFVYHFTLLHYPAADIDSHNFSDVMRVELHESICLSEEMDIFLGNNIPLIYAYSGMYGESLASVIIDKDSCDYHVQANIGLSLPFSQ